MWCLVKHKKFTLWGQRQVLTHIQGSR